MKYDKYFEDIKNLFLEKFELGLYSEKDLEIWLQNELNRNNTVLSGLFSFLATVGGGVFISALINAYLLRDFILQMGLIAIVVILSMVLGYKLIEQTQNNDKVNIKIFEAYYEIKKDIDYLKLKLKFKGA